MRRVFIKIFIGAFCIPVLLISCKEAKEKKIAYIQSAKIYAEYDGFKESYESLENDKKVLQTNLDAQVATYKSRVDSFELSRAKLSKREIALTEELLSKEWNEVLKYKKAIEDNILKQEDYHTQANLNQLNEYIKEYGREQGYAFILGTTNENILYADTVYDITNEILEGLNNKYQGEKTKK